MARTKSYVQFRSRQREVDKYVDDERIKYTPYFAMFTLSTIQDAIRLNPDTFNLTQNEALHQEVNRKYANKVIPNVGLCIALYDVIKTEDGEVKNGDGAIFVKCEFRLIVFSAFRGEILVGWISSCTPEGINVRMEFFDDIFLPKHMLFPNAQFVAKEQAWVWNVNEMDLFLDTNEKLRFRVESNEYSKDGLKIVGSCAEEGLGLISWWL